MVNTGGLAATARVLGTGKAVLISGVLVAEDLADVEGVTMLSVDGEVGEAMSAADIMV